MKVRIVSTTSISDGQGRRCKPGETPDLPADLATAWISAGYAVPVKSQPDTAVRQAPVDASRRKRRGSARHSH